MMDFVIERATREDIPAIQAMAQVVFRRTYADIISPSQMEFMLDWMYSPESLLSQIESPGKAFFIVRLNGENIGYVSVEREEKKSSPEGRPLYHLQKLYLLPAFQGRGYGRRMVEFIADYVRTLHPEGGARIELNVNRSNPAVHFYKAIGMTLDREGDFPIGNGFFMNDYIFALDID